VIRRFQSFAWIVVGPTLVLIGLGKVGLFSVERGSAFAELWVSLFTLATGAGMAAAVADAFGFDSDDESGRGGCR
jgi:hypothetical protein